MSWALFPDMPITPSKEASERKTRGGDWEKKTPPCSRCRVNDYNGMALFYAIFGAFLIVLGLLTFIATKDAGMFFLLSFFGGFFFFCIWIAGFQDAAKHENGNLLVDRGRPRHECSGYCARWRFPDGTYQEETKGD